MLIAVQIVLARLLSFRLIEVYYSFGFIAIIVAAFLYGPIGGMVVAGLGDFIGANLFPMGPYFWGFTATAILNGLIYGLFLHKKNSPKKLIIGLIISSTLTQLIGSVFLNTYWLSQILGKGFMAMLQLRLYKAYLFIIIEPIIAFLVLQAIIKTKLHLRYQ